MKDNFLIHKLIGTVNTLGFIYTFIANAAGFSKEPCVFKKVGLKKDSDFVFQNILKKRLDTKDKKKWFV